MFKLIKIVTCFIWWVIKNLWSVVFSKIGP